MLNERDVSELFARNICRTERNPVMDSVATIVLLRRIERHSVHEKGSVIKYHAMDGLGTKSQNGAPLARMRNSEIGDCKAKVATILLRGLKHKFFRCMGIQSM